MSKRPAEPSEQELETIKNGERPMEIDQDEAGEFEDEFEDEFESEDEILEAGVDGRPDEEREAEERERKFCGLSMQNMKYINCILQMLWKLIKIPSFPVAINFRPDRHCLPIFRHTKCFTHWKLHGLVFPAILCVTI
jgi:hypothetical protein